MFWPGWSRPFVNFSWHHFAPLAQLVEATDLDSVRWRFESVVEHQLQFCRGSCPADPSFNARLAQP